MKNIDEHPPASGNYFIYFLFTYVLLSSLDYIKDSTKLLCILRLSISEHIDCGVWAARLCSQAHSCHDAFRTITTSERLQTVEEI